MLDSPWLFLGLVFLAVFLLTQGMTVPVFGESSKMRKRLLARLSSVGTTNARADFGSLLREKYLRRLSPLERGLETLPGMARLAQALEQSGSDTPAYRIFVLSIVFAVLAGLIGWVITRLPLFTIGLGLAGFSLPYLKIVRDRARRLAKFEEQFPEALDVIKRALKAGHPFTQALKLVAEDMEDPVGREFDLVFSEITYGGDVRAALRGLLERLREAPHAGQRLEPAFNRRELPEVFLPQQRAEVGTGAGRPHAAQPRQQTFACLARFAEHWHRHPLRQQEDSEKYQPEKQPRTI